VIGHREWRYDAHLGCFYRAQRAQELDRTVDVLSLLQRKNGNRRRGRADVDSLPLQSAVASPNNLESRAGVRRRVSPM